MNPEKPLGGKAYGSIPHLPGSKFGNREDKGLDEKAARFFTGEQKLPKEDRIIVLEKLDGSCVSVANIDGESVPLIRSGYRAITSNYLQHHLFAVWVHEHQERFTALKPGERICGEWLAQAHGTRYDLSDGFDPFVPFDLFIGSIRQPYFALMQYCNHNNLWYAPVIYIGFGIGHAVEDALYKLGETGSYGALELAEGCVWRWERTDPKFPIMMAKFVRPEKEPGKYLEGTTGKEAIWNWRPGA